MPSDAVIDLEQLLAPIEGDNPAGKDLTATTVITELREMRKSDEGDSMGDWALKEANVPSWPKIVKLASKTLTEQSKDIRVAGYLTEALIRQFGLPGMRDGVRLMRELQERFWDHFYPSVQPPQPDEEGYVEEEESGIELRSAALGQIDRLLPMAVRGIRCTKPSVATTFYSQLDWELANYLENLKIKDQKAYDERVAEGAPTVDLFRKAVSQTPRTYYENWIADLDQCHQELKLLNALIEERYTEAEQVPTLSDTAKTLEAIEQMVFDIEKVVGPLRARDEEETPGGAEGETGGGGEGGGKRRAFTGEGVPLEPQDRQDAIRRLQAVASYFRQNEPHSPIGYLIERAVYWSSLPFEKWLEEVVKDMGVLAQIRETLGIKSEEGSSGY